MAVEDARSEVVDHEDHLDNQRPTATYLRIDRFKRKMDVSDEDWFDSLPNALAELRKGRRDMLRAVIEAAESLEQIHTQGVVTTFPCPGGPSGCVCETRRCG